MYLIIKKLMELIKKTIRPEIIAVHCDNHHPGDEISKFAFKDEMGRMTVILDIGQDYTIEYSIPLETTSGKQITKATGTLLNVDGYFGLTNATIWYADNSHANKDLIIGLINGMRISKINN